MIMYAVYRRYLWLIRIVFLFLMGLAVSVVIALSQINLETLRGNILSVMRDTLNLPVEIDGSMSWRFSLRPEIEFNSVRIPNADWAKNKNLFVANKIDVRLDLISLLRAKPVIRYIKIYDAKIAVEKNADGKDSIVFNETQKGEAEEVAKQVEKYPVSKLPFFGLEIDNLSADIYGDKYHLVSFGIHNYMRADNIEYSGWVKPYDKNFPFVISFAEYNSDRKIYPVRIAFATGGQALISDIALEGTSKIPIDFVVRGEIPDVKKSGDWFNLDMVDLPKVKVNVAGGFDRNKLSFRKSSISVNGSDIDFSGSYDWSKNKPVIRAKITSNNVNLYKSFPDWYGVGVEWIHPKRDLNCFHDMPLFGKFFYDADVEADVKIKNFFVYRNLNLSDFKAKLNVANHKMLLSAVTGFASGKINTVLDADIDERGVYNAQWAGDLERVYIGDILNEINVDDVISGLPVNCDFYMRAHGSNMSEIMKTMTGPLFMYSVDRGHAHADLVEYMYGGDFLTSLRHNVEDLFTGNKRDMIRINNAVANIKIRDGLIETKNGVAVETQVINMRLAGTLDLGKEKIQLSLATVPVRGLKLSLSGNVVNALEITGNLAEPDFKISAGAIAGKVGSAVGLGLLLSPLTGGLSIAGGLLAGLLAGDLLESWLADEHPCDTAKKKGAHSKRDDPEWLGTPVKILAQPLLDRISE